MVSVEPHFDLHQDRLWDLDLNPEARRVEPGRLVLLPADPLPGPTMVPPWLLLALTCT